MSIEIKLDKILLFNNKEIYRTESKIYDALVYDKNKIIVHINSKINNLFCLDNNGKMLWIAQSIAPKNYLPYQAFSILDSRITASADMPSYSVGVTIDPETGKILTQDIGK